MRRRIVGLATVLLTFPVAACGPDPARPPTEYRLLLPAADFWSGSQTVILVETLPPPDGPWFELFLDGQPLEAESTEPASIVVRLPEAPGEHQLSATIAGGTVLINHETIRLHGFRGRVDYGPLKGTLRHWPGGSATVLGIGPTGPALLDLRTGVAMRWADSVGGPACNLGGLGPSWRPDHFVMQGRTGADSSQCGGYRSWQLLPTLAPAADPYPAPIAISAPWAMAEVAPGRWIATTDDDTFAHDCRFAGCFFPGVGSSLVGEGGIAIVLSPRGDRVVIDGRARVVDPETLTLLYRIDGFFLLYDALFFPGGDSLLVVGYEDAPGRPEHMRIVRPDDGALLADLSLAGPDGTVISPTGLALDPVGPWIYVAGEIRAENFWQPALLIVNRSTLEAETLLRTPAEEFPYPLYDGLTVVPAPLDGRVYVVWNRRIYTPPTEPTGVYIFDRLPD